MRSVWPPRLKIEAALAETYRIPNGHEVRLDGQGKHVFVLLVGSDFESTEGDHGVFLENGKENTVP